MSNLVIKKKSLSKIILGLLAVALVIGGFIVFTTVNPTDPSETGNATIDSSGNQIIEISAKAGFKPNFINASAGKESTLKINTKNTFDCSSTITIASLGIYNVQLPFSGVKEIPIPPQLAGTELDGSCSMGMYSFKIKFS